MYAFLVQQLYLLLQYIISQRRNAISRSSMLALYLTIKTSVHILRKSKNNTVTRLRCWMTFWRN